MSILIRRLVRAVRRGSCEAVAQVERPQQSATSRWRPTSWVHDGYTARPGTISLGTAPACPPMGADQRSRPPPTASTGLLRTRRVARLWPGGRAMESMRNGQRARQIRAIGRACGTQQPPCPTPRARRWPGDPGQESYVSCTRITRAQLHDVVVPVRPVPHLRPRPRVPASTPRTTLPIGTQRVVLSVNRCYSGWLRVGGMADKDGNA